MAKKKAPAKKRTSAPKKTVEVTPVAVCSIEPIYEYPEVAIYEEPAPPPAPKKWYDGIIDYFNKIIS